MAYQGRWRDEGRFRLDESERLRWDSWRDEADHGRSLHDNDGYDRGSGREPDPYRMADGGTGQRRAAIDRRGIGPRGYVRSEARIREDVCDFLSDDPLVDATDIEVSVAGTEVTLAGTVETRRERRRAEDCAERVSGVTHVQNNLRVAREQAEGAGIPLPTPPFI
ncbi:MAG TPA: BON domain-containing protein [Steroidobacteraceae bacterium]|nr:BON domain-containing protein [Steroidobacteraceae bacterium]